MDATYGDLLLHSDLRGLSSGKCLERFFFLMRNEILIFLSDYVKPYISTLEEQLQEREFLKELAFLTDITGRLNDLNTKLQCKDQSVTSLFGTMNGFRNKLTLHFSLTLNGECWGHSDMTY